MYQSMTSVRKGELKKVLSLDAIQKCIPQVQSESPGTVTLIKIRPGVKHHGNMIKLFGT